jgi:hypothetical protein
VSAYAKGASLTIYPIKRNLDYRLASSPLELPEGKAKLKTVMNKTTVTGTYKKVDISVAIDFDDELSGPLNSTITFWNEAKEAETIAGIYSARLEINGSDELDGQISMRCGREQRPDMQE